MSGRSTRGSVDGVSCFSSSSSCSGGGNGSSGSRSNTSGTFPSSLMYTNCSRNNCRGSRSSNVRCSVRASMYSGSGSSSGSLNLHSVLAVAVEAAGSNLWVSVTLFGELGVRRFIFTSITQHEAFKLVYLRRPGLPR